MINENDYTLINRYIDKDLTPLEIKEFEKRLLEDDNLTRELEVVKSMSNFLKHRSSLNTMQKTIKEEAEKNSVKENLVPFYKNKYAQLAAAILLLLVSIPLIKTLISPSPTLYQKYAIHSQLSGELGDNEIPDITTAIYSFNRSEYKSALVEFEKSPFKNVPNLKLAKGICYLELGQFEKAKYEFNFLVQESALFKSKALWYLALTALKEKKYPECKNHLKRIDKESYYYSNAMDLLESLKDR